MSRPVWIVDAFADRPFTGNPAGVVLLDEPADDVWMASVAAEISLSETAFLHGSVLRWFTPVAEIDLCGHATLATAHVLFETGRLSPDARAAFDTRSGRLEAWRDGDGIAMDFPARRSVPATPDPEVLAALGIDGDVEASSVEDGNTLLEVPSEAAVRALEPDHRRLGRTAAKEGVIVTARASTDGWDFVSRALFPAYGIDEDPVTGAAHCALAPYWAERLGRDALVGYQASARGGVVRVVARADRVELGGRAVTVVEGELRT